MWCKYFRLKTINFTEIGSAYLYQLNMHFLEGI